MKLIKRVIEVGMVVVVIVLFMLNKEVQVDVNFFGIELKQVDFWILVTVCVSVGILIAAIADFLNQLKWRKEKRTMVKADRERSDVEKDLKQRIEDLEKELAERSVPAPGLVGRSSTSAGQSAPFGERETPDPFEQEAGSLTQESTENEEDDWGKPKD